MFPIQDQISVATKTTLEAQYALYASLTNKTLESIEKLVDLNIRAVKASMEESAVTARQILAAKDPQEIISLFAAQTRPNFEKAFAYTGHVANIASSAQSEFTKAAEMQIAQVSSKVNELVDTAAKKAPAGTESMIAFMKTALGNANAGYEQLRRTAKQAMEAADANITTVVAEMPQAGTQEAAAPN